MPYKKRYTRSRLGRTRSRAKSMSLPRRLRGYYRKVGFYGKFNRKQSTVFQEWKFFDTESAASVQPATTGTITNLSLNLIPQGTSESERIGRKCTIRSIEIVGDTGLNPTTNLSQVGDFNRIIVYIDKQCNGASAAVLDILRAADHLSFRNLAEIKRFRILWDKTHTHNATAAGGNGTANDSAHHVKRWHYKKMLNLPIEFDDTTGAITEIRSNNIGILMITASARVTLHYNVRLRFTG